jgi:hypothetical protein
MNQQDIERQERRNANYGRKWTPKLRYTTDDKDRVVIHYRPNRHERRKFAKTGKY